MIGRWMSSIQIGQVMAMSIEHIIPEPEVVVASHQTTGVNWLNIAFYLVLTFELSWTVWIVLRAIGVPLVVYAAIGMFGPALAATIVRLTRHEGFADAGLRLVGRGVKKGGGWLYLAAYVSVPVLLALGIVLALLTGVQHWAFADNVHQMSVAIVDAVRNQGQKLPVGMSADQLATISIIG